jgi:phosphatidylinositol alpha-1,6-mannosyltransferase
MLAPDSVEHDTMQRQAARRDLFLFLEVFDREGGIQTYNRNLIEAYLKRPTAHRSRSRSEVLILRDTDSRHNPYVHSDLRFRYFHRDRPVPVERLHFSWALLLSILRDRPRRIYCGHINLAPLIHTLCAPFGIPYTAIVHGKEVWEPLPPSKRRALQRADRIWVVSRYSRDLASAANDLDPNRVRQLSCCVDGAQFHPGPKPPHLLDRYGLDGATVILTVARLWSGDIYKGVDVTLRALPTIAKAIPTVKYVVIGRGDDRPRLEALAADLGVRDRVVFAGFIASEELPAHYRLADLYSMPSQEGFGIVYLEAMASGVPVVAGDNDGSADPLMDGKLGWRVPHRSPEAVAIACIEALKGGDRRSDGDWLRREVLAAFSKDAFADRVAALVDHP